MDRKNIRFAAFLTLAVVFSVTAWLGDPGQKAVWLGLSTVFLVLAIMARRRSTKCGPSETP